MLLTSKSSSRQSTRHPKCVFVSEIVILLKPCVYQGSAYFKNEERKNEEITAKIQKLREQWNSVIKLDLRVEDQDLQRTMAQFERDLSRWIVHVDMDGMTTAMYLLRYSYTLLVSFLRIC